MPQIQRPPAYPNVLVVTGTDLYSGSDDPRTNLRNFLYAQTAQESPVRQGTHDFWCVFGLPTAPGGEAGQGWDDQSLTPWPMRGIPINGTMDTSSAQ